MIFKTLASTEKVRAAIRERVSTRVGPRDNNWKEVLFHTHFDLSGHNPAHAYLKRAELSFYLLDNFRRGLPMLPILKDLFSFSPPSTPLTGRYGIEIQGHNLMLDQIFISNPYQIGGLIMSMIKALNRGDQVTINFTDSLVPVELMDMLRELAMEINESFQNSTGEMYATPVMLSHSGTYVQFPNPALIDLGTPISAKDVSYTSTSIPTATDIVSTIHKWGDELIEGPIAELGDELPEKYYGHEGPFKSGLRNLFIFHPINEVRLHLDHLPVATLGINRQTKLRALYQALTQVFSDSDMSWLTPLEGLLTTMDIGSSSSEGRTLRPTKFSINDFKKTPAYTALYNELVRILGNLKKVIFDHPWVKLTICVENIKFGSQDKDLSLQRQFTPSEGSLFQPPITPIGPGVSPFVDKEDAPHQKSADPVKVTQKDIFDDWPTGATSDTTV